MLSPLKAFLYFESLNIPLAAQWAAILFSADYVARVANLIPFRATLRGITCGISPTRGDQQQKLQPRERFSS